MVVAAVSSIGIVHILASMPVKGPKLIGQYPWTSCTENGITDANTYYKYTIQIKIYFTNTIYNTNVNSIYNQLDNILGQDCIEKCSVNSNGDCSCLTVVWMVNGIMQMHVRRLL